MEQVIIEHSFDCPWDMFKCPDAETAKTVRDALKAIEHGVVKMSYAVRNMVKIDRDCSRDLLFETIKKVIPDVIFESNDR